MIEIVERTVYVYCRCESIDEVRILREGLTFSKKILPFRRRPIVQKTCLYIRRGQVVVAFRGLTLEIETILKKHKILYRKTVEYEKLKPSLSPASYSMVSTLRPYQTKALQEVIMNNGGIIWMATNAGKTEIAGAVLHTYSKSKFLYLVHRLELLDQTVSRFRDKFGLTVGIISSSEQDLDSTITVAMINTVYSRRDELAEFLSRVDGVIVDECHHSAGKMYREVVRRCTASSFRLGMTGTLSQDKAGRLSVIKLFGPVVYRITNRDLIDSDYSTPARVLIMSGEWGTDIGPRVRQWVQMERMGLQSNLWHNVYMEAFIKNTARNKAIAGAVSQLTNYGYTGIVVFVDYIEHGETLSTLTGLPFVSAQSSDRDTIFEQFKQGKLNGLVTSPILEEGIDVSRISVLVIASGKKSQIKLLQRVGRGLRKEEGKDEVLIVDLMDDEIPMLAKHTDKRLEVYRQDGFPVDFVTLKTFSSKLVENKE